jgi:DNA replication protein DnaC
MRNKEDWKNFERAEYLKQFTPRIREVLSTLPDLDYCPDIQSMYIYGDVNVGKTIEAASMMLQEQKTIYLHDGPKDHTQKCIFVSVPELFNEIKSTFNPNSEKTEQDILNYYYDAHLLVLDDFGTVKPTDWVLQTLYLIVNYRYDFLKKTIFTSNLSLQEVAKIYGDDRITSRIDRMCVVFQKINWRK